MGPWFLGLYSWSVPGALSFVRVLGTKDHELSTDQELSTKYQAPSTSRVYFCGACSSANSFSNAFLKYLDGIVPWPMNAR